MAVSIISEAVFEIWQGVQISGLRLKVLKDSVYIFGFSESQKTKEHSSENPMFIRHPFIEK